MMRLARPSSNCAPPPLCRRYLVRACRATLAIRLISPLSASPRAHSHAHSGHTVLKRASTQLCVQEARLARPRA